jgi:hypothetical protein
VEVEAISVAESVEGAAAAAVMDTGMMTFFHNLSNCNGRPKVDY